MAFVPGVVPAGGYAFLGGFNRSWGTLYRTSNPLVCLVTVRPHGCLRDDPNSQLSGWVDP